MRNSKVLLNIRLVNSEVAIAITLACSALEPIVSRKTGDRSNSINRTLNVIWSIYNIQRFDVC
jgi:hypothetical protein